MTRTDPPKRGIIVQVILFPFLVVGTVLRVIIWIIVLPFRLLAAIMSFPGWFLGWFFSLFQRTHSAPATIMRLWSDPVPGASWRYWTYVLFDVRGQRIQLRLTYYQSEDFVAQNSEGDVGHLKYRGSRLVSWEPASVAHPIEPPGRRPRVFLSYAHEWSDDAAYVAQFLAARGIEVWQDTGNLRVGDRLNTEIDRAIAGSNCFVLLMAPEYFASEWCMRELELALKGNCVMLPVKVSTGDLVIAPHLRRLYKDRLGDPVFIDLRQRDPTALLGQLADRILRPQAWPITP